MPVTSLLDRPSRRRAALYAVTLAAYATSLLGPFQFDDFGVIVRYEPVHSLSAFWAAHGHGIRPLLKLTYALCWGLGLGPLGFHLGNLLIHLVNVELTLRLYVAASHREEKWPFANADTGAFVAGLLFAVHPIQTEAVTYISGRSSSLMTLFVLVSTLLYAASCRSSVPWRFLPFALLAFACAVLTKEVAATLPAGLLLWELVIERPRARDLAVRQGAFAVLLVGAFVGAVMNTGYFTLLYRVLGARPLVDSFRRELVGAAYLLSRLVLVRRLSIDPGLGLHSPSTSLVVLAAGVVGTVAAIAVTQFRQRPVVAFGAAWFLLQAFLPYVLLPRADVANERQMYLANAGVFAGVASFGVGLLGQPSRARMARTVVGVVATVLVAVTASRNLDYRSELALWESTVRVSPENPRAHNNLGTVYESAGRLLDARDAYAAALALEPRYTAAERNLFRVAHLPP